MVPDVSGIDKAFDYRIPGTASDVVGPGSLVRIDLNGRRVGGWVTELDIVPPDDVTLRDVAKVSSIGPSAEIIALARWAAHRWAGRLASILRTASPERMAPRLPRAPDGADPTLPEPHEQAACAFDTPGVTVVRLAPAEDVAPYVLAAARLGDAVIVAPNLVDARRQGAILRRSGARVHLAGRDFVEAATAGSVIGARSAVWATVRSLAAILVIDEHEESLQEERNPTWHAREVAIERARRAGVPCVLISPSPSVAASVAADRALEPTRGREREGWPIVRVVDLRTDESARGGLFSSSVVELVRSDRRVLCILNRKGRAKMLACATCGELIRTEDGEHLMSEVDGRLEFRDETRPLICALCGGTKLKRLRLGVNRAAEELGALVGEPVGDVTARTESDEIDRHRVVVGTEALLHRAVRGDAVVFLDFDQELLAPRYRAAEEAMALLVRAARIVQGRGDGGQILVQTRTPDHRVLEAVVRADPGRFVANERELRETTGFPPFSALAEVSGASAQDFVELMREQPDVEILGPRADGRYLVRAATPEVLADRLAATPRPKGRLRVAVDPPRI